MVMQIKRTSTVNLAPSVIDEGQLAVEMASTPPKLWVGVPYGIEPTGRRLLNETAVVATGATVSNVAPNEPQDGALWHNTNNGRTYVWNGDYWAAVTRGATVSPTAPVDPESGMLWFDLSGAQLYAWTGQEWVIAVNQPGAPGPKGPPGDPGPRGPPGPPGAGGIGEAIAGVSSFNSRTGDVTLTLSDITGVGGAPLASPNFNGTPTTPAPASTANSQQIPNVGFINAWYATLASPALTGTPTTSTPPSRVTSTQIVNGAFLNNWYFPLTGGTISPGPVIVQASANQQVRTSASATVCSTTYNGPSGSNRGVEGKMNGISRWDMHLGDNTAEVGSNSGSNFSIRRYSDAGANLDGGVGYTFRIMRNTGAAEFRGSTTIHGGIFGTILGPASDVRIKENIKPSDVDALAALSNIPMVRYELKHSVKEWYNRTKNPSPQSAKIGMVSQSVEKYIPEAVGIIPPVAPDSPFPEKTQTLKMNEFVPYLIRAVQQLAARVEELESEASS